MKKPDLSTLATLAHQREDENWEFRCTLKQSAISFSAIDQSVKAYYREALSKIQCTECGNCCAKLPPTLKPTDIRRLSRHLGQTVSHFTEAYLRHDAETDAPTFKSAPCPFLSSTMCSVYEHRPAVCRSFPHLHKPGFIFRTMQAYLNVSICPIVFEVYEGLKGQYSRPPQRKKLPNQAL